MLAKIFAFSLLILVATPAVADPATHTFVIVEAQSGRGDCGGGSCTNYCKLVANITNVSPGSSGAATLFFKYPHPGLEPGTLATTGFGIPPLVPNQSTTDTEWIYGLKCDEVLVRSITAKCDGTGCPYAAIRVTAAPVPKIRAMKIDVDF